MDPNALKNMWLEMERRRREREANDPRRMLQGQAWSAGAFADQAQQNYGNMTAESQATRDYLAGLMRGDNSLAKEQFRQMLGQTTGQLRSQAAAASPQNAGMAALQASNNLGRTGAAMSGNAAMAGIAERNAKGAAAAQAAFDQHIREAAGAGGPAGEIHTAQKLLDVGTITQDEFDTIKAKALAR